MDSYNEHLQDKYDEMAEVLWQAEVERLTKWPSKESLTAQPIGVRERLCHLARFVINYQDTKEKAVEQKTYPIIKRDPSATTVNVPIIPTSVMWDGLARAIMMWLDFGNGSKTPKSLFKHLKASGRDIPEWLRNEEEMKHLDHVPSKGTRCFIIYRAMIEDYLADQEEKRIQEDAKDGTGLPDIRPVMALNAASSWLGDVATGTWSWVRNTRAKYVTLRLDTRNGVYSVLDRDDKALTEQELLWQFSELTPEPEKNTSSLFPEGMVVADNASYDKWNGEVCLMSDGHIRLPAGHEWSSLQETHVVAYTPLVADKLFHKTLIEEALQTAFHRYPEAQSALLWFVTASGIKQEYVGQGLQFDWAEQILEKRSKQ